jgi:hypothetical protein
MAKVFTKDATIVDEVLPTPARYDIQENDGTPFKSNMQINMNVTPTVPGTSINAAIMNNLENGLDTLDNKVSDIEVGTSGSSVVSSIKAWLKAYTDTLYMFTVAPGTSGNVLTSTGTGWTSSAKSIINNTYGDGSDGDVVISSTVTLTRDMFYRNLTVTSTGILIPAGYIIYVSGILTIQGNGIIAANGTDGTAGSGGTGGTGGAGAVGTTLHYPIATSGGNGGNSGGSGTANGTGGTAGASQSTAAIAPMWMRAGGGGGGGAGHGSTPTNGGASTGPFSGAKGGNGGATTSATSISSAGGGGGGGGGVIDIRAYIISNSGLIQAAGGNGGSAQGGANGGGGGGGGGGSISITYHAASGNGTGTLDVHGGAAGTSGSASAGASGYTMTTQI